MADPNRSQIAHLYRRAGFGASPQQLAASSSQTYAGAVDALFADPASDPGVLATPAPAFSVTTAAENETAEERKARQVLRNQQQRQLLQWWVHRMTVAERPLREKTTFFWHAHFATSVDKVREATYMLKQNETLRTLGLGTFEPLVQAIAVDPAMMIWLDGNQNRKGSPNENFARECMELFTIGIGSYTDADVREAARAFTGTRVVRQTATVERVPRLFDDGTKTVLGRTGNFNGQQIVSLLATEPAAARFVTAKLWSRFAYPVTPEDSIVSELSATFKADWSIGGLLKRMFLHPEFVGAKARQGLVKQPVEYVVGTLRSLGISPSALGARQNVVLNSLRSLNQVPFDPPSVGGWPQNGYWISTATALARANFANVMVGQANLSWLNGLPAASRPQKIAEQLGVDSWTPATLSALMAADRPKTQVVTALISPEYILN